MKKTLFFLAFAITIVATTTAFIINEDSVFNSETTKAPIDYNTMNTFGMNLDSKGELKIMDNQVFRTEVDKMIKDAGFDYQINNIIARDAVTNGKITAKTYLVQYSDNSDEHTVTISYSNSLADQDIVPEIKILPICVNLGCNSGCRPGYSPAGVFSCTACVGPWYSSCTKTYIPVII